MQRVCVLIASVGVLFSGTATAVTCDTGVCFSLGVGSGDFCGPVGSEVRIDVAYSLAETVPEEARVEFFLDLPSNWGLRHKDGEPDAVSVTFFPGHEQYSFVWGSIPRSGTFSLTVVKDGANRKGKVVIGQFLYSSPEGAGESAIQVLFSTEACPVPTFDIDGDGRVSLTELLRMIQFYNRGAISCLWYTEDGFEPSGDSHACTPHSSDYLPQDWVISLSELLRVIQFYKSPGGYTRCPDSEDGYCPSPMS